MEYGKCHPVELTYHPSREYLLLQKKKQRMNTFCPDMFLTSYTPWKAEY